MARRWIVAASAVVVCLAVVAAGVAWSAQTPHDAASATAGQPTALRPTTSPPTVSLPSDGVPDAGAPSDDGVPDRGVLPPVPARVDYQLGGLYDPDPSVGIVVRDRAAGFDFAVAEDCQVWSECDAYTEVYDAVIEVEYTDAGFAAACSQRGTAVSVQRRDLALAPRGDRAHVARWC